MSAFLRPRLHLVLPLLGTLILGACSQDPTAPGTEDLVPTFAKANASSCTFTPIPETATAEWDLNNDAYEFTWMAIAHCVGSPIDGQSVRFHEVGHILRHTKKRAGGPTRFLFSSLPGGSADPFTCDGTLRGRGQIDTDEWDFNYRADAVCGKKRSLEATGGRVILDRREGVVTFTPPSINATKFDW